jgi:hypothetical protein
LHDVEAKRGEASASRQHRVLIEGGGERNGGWRRETERGRRGKSKAKRGSSESFLGREATEERKVERDEGEKKRQFLRGCYECFPSTKGRRWIGVEETVEGDEGKPRKDKRGWEIEGRKTSCSSRELDEKVQS